MDVLSAISILEALADGCDPVTGERLDNESVLHQREVIRTLQFAIDKLRKDAGISLQAYNTDDLDLDLTEIQTAIQLFHDQHYPPTKSRLTSFFLANRQFRNPAFTSHPLFGKYKNIYTKGQLLGFFADYLSGKKPKPDHQSLSGENENPAPKHDPIAEHENTPPITSTHSEKENAPWKSVTFFHKPHFNELSQADIEELKERVNELGITKTEGLPPNIIAARKEFPRAYEPWSETEIKLLDDALRYTNNLVLLSQCFQRNENAISSCGKRIIYERKTP